MTVTCGLTAKKPGSAPSQTLVIEYGTTFLLEPQASPSKNYCYRPITEHYAADGSLSWKLWLDSWHQSALCIVYSSVTRDVAVYHELDYKPPLHSAEQARFYVGQFPQPRPCPPNILLELRNKYQHQLPSRPTATLGPNTVCHSDESGVY